MKIIGIAIFIWIVTFFGLIRLVDYAYGFKKVLDDADFDLIFWMATIITFAIICLII